MGCGGSKNEVINTKQDFKEDNENNNTSKNNDNIISQTKGTLN